MSKKKLKTRQTISNVLQPFYRNIFCCENEDNNLKIQNCLQVHGSFLDMKYKITAFKKSKALQFQLSTSSPVHQISCTNPPVCRTVLGHLVIEL